ncbi:hypothetical protein PspLS_01122 [Pyricularia sp. CBS 133598]|nr:hypothetical protein PspLS_01122 [Pyricularia sp. CBS 133598]
MSELPTWKAPYLYASAKVRWKAYNSSRVKFSGSAHHRAGFFLQPLARAHPKRLYEIWQVRPPPLLNVGGSLEFTPPNGLLGWSELD